MRMLDTQYLPAMQALKQGEIVVIKNTPRAYIMASRLVEIGKAKWGKRGRYQILDPVQKQPKTGEIAVLRTRRGVTTTQYTIAEKTGEYHILKHPVLGGKLYRKLAWDSDVNGWVAA